MKTILLCLLFLGSLIAIGGCNDCSDGSCDIKQHQCKCQPCECVDCKCEE